MTGTAAVWISDGSWYPISVTAFNNCSFRFNSLKFIRFSLSYLESIPQTILKVTKDNMKMKVIFKIIPIDACSLYHNRQKP